MAGKPVNCPECRAWFEARRHDQAYCGAACSKAASDRELKRARRVYRALYHWRLWWRGKGRVNPGENLRFICNEVAAWIREDRDAQRLPPPPHVFDADRGHQRQPRRVRLARGLERRKAA